MLINKLIQTIKLVKLFCTLFIMNGKNYKLTHSFLTAKQLCAGFLTFFLSYFYNQFIRPEHDCYAKFTSCST